MAGRPWDASYQDGPAPWDIDKPQPAVVRLASEGAFAGTVLDVGCGTGENALHLAALGRFHTILDCGLFHTFDRDERTSYVASLASVTEPNGSLYMLCFRDGPGAGPHPVSEQEIRAAFGPGSGWEIAFVQLDRLETRIHDDSAPAWCVRIKRTGTESD